MEAIETNEKNFVATFHMFCNLFAFYVTWWMIDISQL